LIKAKHTWWGDRFFEWYVNRIIHKDFHSLIFDAPEVEKDKAMLVLGNHFSWWDGFFIYYVSNKIFKKKFHVMMLEDELAQRKPLQYWGAFSIRKKHKSIFETFDYAARLLEDPKNLVLIYPQGKIQSMLVDEIEYQKGFFRILENARKPFQLLFSTAFIEYFSERKPTVNVYFEKYKSENYSLLEVSAAHNDFYKKCKEKHQSINI
jgi:1-acyl-sn-glycerol-3-phosphate acyltransferase